MEKSSLLGINVDDNLVDTSASTMGCGVGSWPIKYLGLPLGGNPLSLDFWKLVIEKVARRLDRWKKGFLSRGGRATLIQSVLASMPIYMSVFRLPGRVADMLEKMMRSFLWDSREAGKGRSLVGWDLVTRTKETGGLGLGNLKKRNVVLLGKWLWRFHRKHNSLWARIIKSKYGLQNNGWDTKVVTNGSFRNPWKFISQGLTLFSRHLALKVENGTKILFWKDSWKGDTCFAVLFPRLFRLTSHPRAIVADTRTSDGNWTFGFRRELNARENEELTSLLQSLQLVALTPVLDTRIWVIDTFGFTCKSFFVSLLSVESLLRFHPFKFIWKSSIPYRVKVFAWLVVHGKVNTCDLVQRRNPNMALSPSWCVLCRKQNETIDHLLMHCETATKFWNQLFYEAGLSWVVQEKCCALFVERMASFGSNKMARALWNSMIVALMWTI